MLDFEWQTSFKELVPGRHARVYRYRQSDWIPELSPPATVPLPKVGVVQVVCFE